MSETKPAKRNAEYRSTIFVPKEQAAPFKAARDRHGTTTPHLFGAMLAFFESLSVERQAAMIRGEFAVE